MAKRKALYQEVDQQPFAQEKLTDLGDRKTFEASVQKFSDADGARLQVVQSGVLTGGHITAGTADDTVDVENLTANINGESNQTVSGSSVSILRASTETHKVNSIIVDANKSIDVVEGTEGSSFVNDQRGVAGSAPYIPVDAIEIGQVRTNSATSAPLKSEEIKQSEGLYRESANVSYETNPSEASITFIRPLPAIHVDGETEDLPKRVFAEGFEPILEELINVTNLTLPAVSVSSSSTPVFGGTIAEISESLDSGSYDIVMKKGIFENFEKLKNQNLHFEFYPDSSVNDRIEGQAILGVSKSFPADGNMTASCTLNARTGWNEKSGQ